MRDYKLDPRDTPIIQGCIVEWINERAATSRERDLRKKVKDHLKLVIEALYSPNFDIALPVLGTQLSLLAITNNDPQDTFNWGDLVSAHPDREPPVIDGLLREGQIGNLVSAQKEGKRG